MKRYLDKINSQGIYTEFPGITVLSKTSIEDELCWKKTHDLISKSDLLSSYFSPLPQSSYHLTRINLCTEMSDSRDSWKSFIAERLVGFRALNSALLDVNEVRNVRLKFVRTSSVIQLSFEIPQEQIEIIEAIANSFNIKHKVPKEMHVTLAYQYKLLSKEDSAMLKSYLEEGIKKIFEEHPTISFEGPILASFNNMEDFKPWNAKKNPFIVERFSLYNYFFSKKEVLPEAQSSFKLKL